MEASLAAAQLRFRGRGSSRRLADHLRNEIRRGRFRTGEQLPSIRELTRRYKLGPGTVNRAFLILVEEGLAESRQGSGTYVRNPEPAADHSPRVTAFALAMPEIEPAIYATLIKGFEEVANELHRPMIVCNTNGDLGCQANHLMRLIEQRISGLAIVPPPNAVTPAYQIRQIQQAGIPVVLMHRDISGVTAPVLEIPFKESGKLAAHAISERGHRRIAVFTNEPPKKEDDPCFVGLRDELSLAGIEIDDELVYCGSTDSFDRDGYHSYEEHASDVLERLLKSANPPTCLFVAYEAYAEFSLVTAMRLGLRVPQDLSIVTFGSVRGNGAVGQRLARVGLDHFQTGRKAAQLLEEMGAGRRPIISSDRLILPLALNPAESLGNAPSRSKPFNR